MKNEQDDFEILRRIQNKPEYSQRELAKDLGFSLGKLNYCLKELQKKGLVKIKNFNNNPKKLNYLYILTPKGISAKTKLTIDNLIEQTNQITSDANKLTKALSGDSKTQGDYGELKLEMLLENSGLEENTHYKLQKGFTVKSDGDVSREIPDAVIYLPQNRNIIIDSKFSFTAYNEYCNTEEKDQKEKYGKLLTKNIKDRINDLSNTKYHQIEELTTPDLIFMFLGIDDSLSVALKFDPDLVAYADKKRIALISPSILHISIKMVENLWRLDGQRESVIKVYEEAQKLVDKFGGFTDVMDSLGNSIAQSQKKYDDARNKLIDGKGSVSSRIEGLVSLGSKETKKISGD